jgi:hypothetical protein
VTIRARWLRRFLWLAGFGCLWAHVFNDPPLRSGVYVQNVTEAAATIAKITVDPVAMSVTVSDESGSEVVRKSGRARRRHALRVEGLKAGHNYTYIVRIPEHEEERGSFRTAPALGDDLAPVRFAFVGDSGDQPWWVWQQKTPLFYIPVRLQWFPTRWAVTAVGAAMAAYEPDFAMHLGDVVYPRGQHAHYSSGFFRPFADLLRQAPMYVTLGNHDVMNAAGQQVLANFHLPTNVVTGDERCYSFTQGALRVISLDCNRHLTGDHFMPGHPTHTFLLETLATATEPWIVVASHFPMRSASRQGNDGELLSMMLPELVQAQVTMYLSGHDHCYQRFGPSESLPVPLVVSGGGGKRLYDITKDPRAKIGAKALKKAHHWCSVEVEGVDFQVKAHGVDGEILDEFRLSLPQGADLLKMAKHNPGRAARIRALAGN